MIATLYALGLEVTLVLGLWMAVGAWQKDPATPGRLSFAAMGLALAAWCGGLLVAERGFAERPEALELAHLGLVTVPPMWVGVAAAAARLEIARRVPWLPLVLLLPQLALYTLLHLGPWSQLFPTADLEAAGGGGSLSWVHAVYWHALMLVGTAVFIRTPMRSRSLGVGLWHPLAAAGSLLPLMGSALLLASGASGGRDLTPILFAPFLLLLQNAIFRGGLLDVLPLSQQALIDQLPMGVILTDRAGTVISINPAAQRRLEIAGDQAVGRTVDAVLYDAAAKPRVNAVPVRCAGHEVGQLLLLDGPPKAEPGARRRLQGRPPRA